VLTTRESYSPEFVVLDQKTIHGVGSLHGALSSFLPQSPRALPQPPLAHVDTEHIQGSVFLYPSPGTLLILLSLLLVLRGESQ
jgi:hypothetical protein